MPSVNTFLENIINNFFFNFERAYLVYTAKPSTEIKLQETHSFLM